jgi:hypothetical protein
MLSSFLPSWAVTILAVIGAGTLASSVGLVLFVRIVQARWEEGSRDE